MGNSLAQLPENRQIDSMLKQLAQAKEDTGKVKLIYALAKDYPDYDPNKGLEIAKKGLELATKLGWQKGVVISYFGMGLNECSRSDYKSAETYFKNALETAIDISDRALQAEAVKNTGVAYYGEYNYPEALKSFYSALKLLQELNSGKTFDVYECIGRVYEDQKIYDKALENYQLSYKSAVAAGEVKAKVKNLINLGQVYQELGRLQEAKDCFNQTLTIFRDSHEEGGIAISVACLASIQAQLGDYVTSFRNSFEALAIYQKYADRENIASIMGNVGKTYLDIASDTTGKTLPDSLANKREDLRKSFIYLGKAEILFRELGDINGSAAIYKELSTAYELNGDKANALKYYKSHIALRDSVYSTDNKLKIAHLEINSEMAAKDDELRLKQLELAKRRNENIFFISGIVLMVIISLVLYRNIATQKKLNATITKLVNDQEKIIGERTEALTDANRKLISLIQFNVHNLREPITRILGLMMLRGSMNDGEFMEDCLPKLEQSVTDLDGRLKEVVKTAEQTGTPSRG